MQKTKNRRNYFAQYGNVILETHYCDSCKQNSFIIDGKYACCCREFKIKKIKPIVKVSESTHVRINLPEQVKQEILQKQEYCCYWCDIPLNTIVKRKNKEVKIKTHFDHYIPFAYSSDNNKYNFVASCHICNGIKSSKMFDTEEATKMYLKSKREEKGYDF